MKWLEEHGIKNYTSTGGIVDVDGSVDLIGHGLTSIPVQFGIIRGNFEICLNNLKSLAGGPRHVEGYFDASHNKNMTGVGLPVSVGGNFDIINTKINTLEFFPTIIKGPIRLNEKLRTALKLPAQITMDELQPHIEKFLLERGVQRQSLARQFKL